MAGSSARRLAPGAKAAILPRLGFFVKFACSKVIMNAADIVVVAVALIAIVKGFNRGLILQLGSLLAIIVAIVCCRLFSTAVADFFNGLSSAGDESPGSHLYLNTVIAYILVFVIAYFLAKSVSFFLKKLVHGVHLGIFDRLGGALINAFKWLLALSLAFNLWCAVFPDSEAIKSSAVTGKWVLGFAPEILSSQMAKDIFDTAKGLTGEKPSGSGNCLLFTNG